MKPNELKLTVKAGIIALTMIYCTIVFIGCNKDDINRRRLSRSDLSLSNPFDNAAVTFAEDAEITNASFNEVFNDVQEVINTPTPLLKSGRYNDYCRTITVAPSDSVYPRTYTIVYGTTGCMNWRGKYKTGKISINITAPPADSMSMITVTIDSLAINGNKVEGIKTIQYLGRINNNPTWKTEITGGKVTTPGGRLITYEVKDKLLSLIAGQNTPNNFWDNIYSLSGTSFGTITKDTISQSYTDTIPANDPLILAVFCRYPQGGEEIVTVGKNGVVLRTVNINYGSFVAGSTTCNRNTTVIVNGKVIYSFAKD